MNNTYMLAAIRLNRTQVIAVESMDVDFDDPDYDEEFQQEEASAVWDRATAEWLESYAGEIRQQCADIAVSAVYVNTECYDALNLRESIISKSSTP